jgi:next to BRCA1 gene 1 protein
VRCSFDLYFNDLLTTILLTSIVVAEVSRQADGSERSLASSSIIVMPQSAASARSVAQSDLTDLKGNQQTFPLSRDLPLPVSKSSVDDATSDGGSIGSSVSLISVPSSEDEDEDDWHDSRSHVVNSSPENFRDAAEYIVLFDDTSSDEE